MTTSHASLAPQARAEGKVLDADGILRTVEIDLAESPLAWLKSRRGRDGADLIGDAEYLAGERLRADYTLAGLTKRTTMNWDALGGPVERGRGGRDPDISDAAMAARSRVEAAFSAVGPDLAGVLVDVCCLLRTLGDVERARHYPARSGKVVLRLALSALARHYGLSEAGRGRSAAPMRRWGTPDSRPKA